MRSLFRMSGIAAVAAAVSLNLPLVASANPSEIYMSDACSPSFNVALNDPTICNRQEGTPFGVFIQQLMQNKFAGAWHFSAPRVNVSAGDSTATPPTFFAGPFNFVPASDETTISSGTLTAGTHLFICAIHPWMHETVVVH